MTPRNNTYAKFLYSLFIKFWVICFFLLTAMSSFGQDHLLVKDGSKYIYKGKEYKCKELGLVYKDSEESLRLFKRGRSHSKVALYLGIGGLVIAGAGVGIGVTADDIQAVAVILLMVGVGAIFELVATGFAISSHMKSKKARKGFNLEMLEKYGYESKDLSLSFDKTEHGVGLVFRF